MSPMTKRGALPTLAISVFVVIAVIMLVVTGRARVGTAQPPARDVAGTSLARSENFELVGQLGGARALAVQGDLIYGGAGPRLGIWSARNINHISLVGQSEPVPGDITAVAVSGDRAYATSSDAALLVFDVQNATRPRYMGFHLPADADPSSYAASDLAISDRRAYVADPQGLAIFDLNDGATPQQRGRFATTSGQKVIINGTYAYLLTYHDAIHIVDVSSTDAPVEVGILSLEGARDMAIDGDALYVTAATALYIYDVSNPAGPQLLHRLDQWSGGDYIVAADDVLYISDWHFLRQLDMSNPGAPHKMSEVRLSAEATSLALGAKGIFASTGGRLEAIDLPRPDAMSLLGGDGPSIPLAMAIGGSQLFISSQEGLHIVDVVADGMLVPVSLYSWSVPAQVLAVSNAYVYAPYAQSLNIIDVSDNWRPHLAGQYEFSEGGTVGDVVVTGDVVYLRRSNGVAISVIGVDVADPAQPRLTFELPDTGAKAIAASGDLLYLLAGDTVTIYQGALTGQPVVAGAYTAPESVEDIAANGSLLYTLGSEGTLRLIDVQNPSKSQQVGYTAIPGAFEIYVAGNVAAVDTAYGNSELILLDMSDHADIKTLARFGQSIGEAVVSTSGPTVYVRALNHQGVLALRYTPGASVNIAPSGGSLESAADGVRYDFPAGVFTDTVRVSHTPLSAHVDAVPAGFVPTPYLFELNAATMNWLPVAAGAPFSMTVAYNAARLRPVDESSLALFFWNDSAWQAAPYTLDTDDNQLTATASHFGRWLLAGMASYRSQLPGIFGRHGEVDLEITGIEVTQAIQTPSNSVSLVTGRPAVARLYIRNRGATIVDDATVTLAATRNGAPLAGSPVTAGPWAVYPQSERGSLATSLNLDLPSAWLSGNVTLQATVDAPDDMLEAYVANNVANATIAFNPVPPLQLRIVPVHLTQAYDGAFCAAPSEDFISDYVLQTFPISAVDVSIRQPLAHTGDLGTHEGTLDLLRTVTVLKQMDGAPSHMVYYGVFSAEGQGGEECDSRWAGMAWIGQRTGIGYYDHAETAAHEIGHTFGLFHAPCGNATGPDSEYPYPDGSIGQYGFDVSEYRIWTPGAPNFAKDIMSYCGPSWFSDYHYQKLYLDQSAHGARLSEVSSGEVLQLRVYFDEDNQAMLQPVYMMPGEVALGREQSAYYVALVADSGATLETYPLPLVISGEEDPGSRSIFASVPLPTEPVAAVQILRDGNVVAERALGSAVRAPLSANLQKLADGPFLQLSWSAPELAALVRYRGEDRRTWTTLAFDHTGGALQIDARSLPGPGIIEVRLADGGVGISAKVTVPLSLLAP